MPALFFIVDGENLAAQSTLLASTLLAHNGSRYRLIAYVPSEGASKLPSILCNFYDKCGVEVRPIAPDPDSPASQRFANSGWAKPYPHGNKILASASPREDEWSVFLDTDMICAAPLDLELLMAPGRLALVPEGVATWGNENDRWKRAYDHFGLPMPEDKVRLTRRGRGEYLPYFNAGFVMFPTAPIFGQSQGFGQLWLDTALDFDHGCAIAKKRPWLDQITLPLTMKRFGYNYLVADTALNFSISDRDYEADARPALLHYHRWRYLHAWPQGKAAFAALDKIAGPRLAGLLRKHYGNYFEVEDY